MICWVTDRRRLAADATPADQCAALVDRVRLLAESGVDLVQVRERDLDAGTLARLVERCVAAVSGTPARVLVNDRLDIALACRAHGVHLRSDSVPAARARELVPGGFLIGLAVHSADEARRAALSGGADFLVLGTVFPTKSKPGMDAVVGVGELAAAAVSVRVPVLGIGGVTEDRLDAVARSGAAGFAAIGLFGEPATPGAVRSHTQRIVELARRLFDSREAVPGQ